MPANKMPEDEKWNKIDNPPEQRLIPASNKIDPEFECAAKPE